MMAAITSGMLSKAREILAKHQLCERCLGRQFSAAFPEAGPAQVGKKIFSRIKARKPASCVLCGNAVFERSAEFVKKFAAEAKKWQFDTFWTGNHLPKALLATEEQVWGTGGIEYAEPLKSDLNRELAEALAKRLRKKADFESPDVVFIADFETGAVRTQVKPLYVYGRYLKLVRGIPQTKWPCRECRGRGCSRCGNTGKMYAESVEELLGNVLLGKSGGTGTKFHGAGREDVDALMLGSGRPFVIEMIEPRKRKLNPKRLEAEANAKLGRKIKVREMRIVDKREIALLKAVRLDKTYRALVELARNVDKGDLPRIAALEGVVLMQRTPVRVLHRRADKMRRRTVKGISVKQAGKNRLEMTIRAESGTYIKEFIDGDGGRTQPSVAQALGTAARCVELDVVEVDFGMLASFSDLEESNGD